MAGAWLAHRVSRDIDLFCHDRERHRDLVLEVPRIASAAGFTCRVVRDGGAHVRAVLERPSGNLELDLVHEPAPDLEPAPALLDGVRVESLTDLRASKLTCLSSPAEPRDLVDVFWLEKAGYPPEADLPLALQKDSGVDPGILAWLLKTFPVEPMPVMLQPVTAPELRTYRDALARRFKELSVRSP